MRRIQPVVAVERPSTCHKELLKTAPHPLRGGIFRLLRLRLLREIVPLASFWSLRTVKPVVALVALLLALWPGRSLATENCFEVERVDLSELASNETLLRGATTGKLMCYLDRHDPPVKDALRAVDQYVRLSQQPACELMLWDARLHIRAAQSQLGESQDAIALHWQTAWEMAAEIEYAWSKQIKDDPDMFKACVLPAREILKDYPTVTITVEPRTASGFTLLWDGTRRWGNLPRILPQRNHELRVIPPRGHRAAVWVNGECQTTAEREAMVFVDTRYADPHGTQQIRVNFSPLEDTPGPDEACGVRGVAPVAPPSAEAASRSAFQPGFFWGGVAASVVGAAGLTVSIVQANAQIAEGKRLHDPTVCSPLTAACPTDDILAKYDARDKWVHFGVVPSSIVLGLGVASIVTSFIVGGSKKKARAMSPTPQLAWMPGGFYLGVQSDF